jgi:hypothetical protein
MILERLRTPEDKFRPERNFMKFGLIVCISSWAAIISVGIIISGSNEDESSRVLFVSFLLYPCLIFMIVNGIVKFEDQTQSLISFGFDDEMISSLRSAVTAIIIVFAVCYSLYFLAIRVLIHI